MGVSFMGEDKLEDAVQARKDAEEKHHGEFARDEEFLI